MLFALMPVVFEGLYMFVLFPEPAIVLLYSCPLTTYIINEYK